MTLPNRTLTPHLISIHLAWAEGQDDDQLLMTSRLQLPAYTLICLRRAEKRLLAGLLDELSASN